MGVFSDRNVGGVVKSEIAGFAQDAAGDVKIVTAGATEDDTKVTGETIDRQDYLSGVLNITWAATLGATKTLSLAAEIEVADNSSFTGSTTTALYTATVVGTGAGGGSTEKGVEVTDINLDGEARYVRFNITPDLSDATATDTAIWQADFVMGGRNIVPVSS